MQGGVAESLGLALLYGVTTFLPVSREGHLALAEMLFVPAGVAPTQRFQWACGALLATLIVTSGQLKRMAKALISRLLRRSAGGPSPDERDLVSIGLAQLTTFTFWAALGEARRDLYRYPLVIAVGLTLTAVALFSMAWIGTRRRLFLSPTQALLLGAVQGLALVPGISRIGCTMVAAMWMGLTDRRSFDLSVLISIPLVIVGVAEAGLPAQIHETTSTLALLSSGITAAGGIASVFALRSLVAHEKTAWFSMWVAPLAIATFAFSRAWPGH